jgi:hypothetical protein
MLLWHIVISGNVMRRRVLVVIRIFTKNGVFECIIAIIIFYLVNMTMIISPSISFYFPS